MLAFILLIIAFVYLVLWAMTAAGWVSVNSAIVAALAKPAMAFAATYTAGLAMIGVGALMSARIISKEGYAKGVQSVSKAVGKTTNAVIDLGKTVVDGVVKGVVKPLASSFPWWILIACGAAYFALGGGDDSQ